MTARGTLRESDRDDPLWRVRALAGLDPLSADAFSIRRQPLQRGERRLIGVQFEIMQLIMLFDELADVAGLPQDSAVRLPCPHCTRYREERDAALEEARQPDCRSGFSDAPSPALTLPAAELPYRLAIPPPDALATLIVADEATADAASLAWDASHRGAYGLFVVRDLDALAGGLAPNAGGFADWRHPRPAPREPAATMRWKGRVLIVLPSDLKGFAVSERTKWEKYISADRYAQVLGVLATHWWVRAGACEVRVATLPREDRQSSVGPGSQSGASNRQSGAAS